MQMMHIDVELVPQLETNHEALVVIIEVRDHFVVVVQKGKNKGSDFLFLFVRNHCMLWRRK
jgi:hypothetical protein